MKPLKSNDESLMRLEIPKELNQAIIRIQAAEDLDFIQACKRAAVLADSGREEFKKAVKDGADRLAKSRFMQQINKARKTIGDQEYQRGADQVRYDEDNFHAPCSICGKPMHFSSRDQKWEEEKKTLYQAFSGWQHTTCKK